MLADTWGTEAVALGTFLNLALCTYSSGCLFVSFVISCDSKYTPYYIL